MSKPVPRRITISNAVLTDLRRRLSHARWPESETVDDWSQGAPLARLRRLVEYWRKKYDWHRCEAWLNASDPQSMRIDGLDIHFLHIRSPHADAMPLLLTHGWPGSIIEFRAAAGPLSDPEAHGGTAADAFHLVIPSLPGFGFSGKPDAMGWGTRRIAAAWETLMAALGYQRYVAQGGDWGAAITTELAVRQSQALAGVHVNMPLVLPAVIPDAMSPAEAEMVAAMSRYQQNEAGYSIQQATRPQTLGYGLADSPIGQAAWIYEKLYAWSDCDGDPEALFGIDAILDNIMLYWLTNSGASSARLYWESFADGFGARQVPIPIGCSIFPKELYRAPRSWAEACMPQLIHWNELECGGHFAAFEQPKLFVTELQDCFRALR